MDLRKRALSAAYFGGSFIAVKFPFWFNQNKFQKVKSKSLKKKKGGGVPSRIMRVCQWAYATRKINANKQGPSTYLLVHFLGGSGALIHLVGAMSAAADTADS